MISHQPAWCRQSTFGAQDHGWQLVASTEIWFKVDPDSVGISASQGGFRRLKLTVKDAPLRLVKMVVNYESRPAETITLRSDIPQGGESRIIELRDGGQHAIRGIVLWF